MRRLPEPTSISIREQFFTALRNLLRHPAAQRTHNSFTTRLNEWVETVDGGQWENVKNSVLSSVNYCLNEAHGPKEFAEEAAVVTELVEHFPDCLPLIHELRRTHADLCGETYGYRPSQPMISPAEVMLRLNWSPEKRRLYEMLSEALVKQVHEVDVVGFQRMSPRVSGGIENIRYDVKHGIWKHRTPLDRHYMLIQFVRHSKGLDLSTVRNATAFMTALHSLLDFLSEHKKAIEEAQGGRLRSP